jgi:hypothetical protein
MKPPFSATVAIVAVAMGCGPPAAYPVQVTMKPTAGTLTGAGRCRVLVEAPSWDPAATWGGRTEAEFLTTLQPEARQSHQGDKEDVPPAYLKQITLNERDYVGDAGSVTTRAGGGEPFVLRSRIVSVDTGTGALHIVHELLEQPSGKRVAAFELTAGNVGFGLGSKLRTATIPHAWSVLQYLGHHFACNGPAKAAD